MKKRILVVGSSLKDKGGIVSVMKSIEDSFLKENYEFLHLVTYKNTNIILKNFIFFIAILKSFFMIPKSDIIHIHMSYKGSFYRKSLIILICKMYNKPIILHIHGSKFKEFYFSLKGIKKKYFNYIFKIPNEIVVLSKSWEEFIKANIKVQDILIIKNCVKVPKKIPKNEKGYLQYVFLGRFGKRKGIYDLLSVIGELKKVNKKFKLSIAGDGEIKKVNKEIERLKIEDVVKNLNWINNEEKTELLKNADVFVLPSYNEGLPMAILEAMSYSIPCISTNVGGIPEVIHDNVNGFLIEPGDRKELKQKMEYFMVNAYDVVNKFGENAYNTVLNEYNQDIELKKLDQLYKNI